MGNQTDDKNITGNDTPDTDITLDDSSSSDSLDEDTLTSKISLIIEKKFEAIDKKLAETLSQVDKKNSGLASNIKKKYIQEEQKQKAEVLSLKSLQSELETLKSELTDKEMKIQEREKKSAIMEILSKKGVKPDKAHVATKLILSEYGKDLDSYDGNWYFTKDEDKPLTLNKKIEDYLNSEEGNIFKDSNKYKGIGITNNRVKAPTDTNTKVSLNEALFS